MLNKTKKILIGIFMLGASASALALGGTNLSDNVDVSVTIERYADIQPINAEEWYKVTGNEKKVLHALDNLKSSFGQMLDDWNEVGALLNMAVRKELGLVSVKNDFSGKGNEARFSVIPINFLANLSCHVNVDVSPFKAEGSDEAFENFKGTYMVAFSSLGRSLPTSLLLENNESNTGMSGDVNLNPEIHGNGRQEYAIVSAVQMPSEFWKVAAGTYTSTITLTVEGY